MNHHLFQEPVSTFSEQKIREAKARAEQLTDEQLQGPNLAETLREIATLKFRLATLKPAERRGKRRTEKRTRPDYGQQVTVDVDIIDVTIPFDGWPKSFHLAPSYYNDIGVPAALINNAIQVSFLDDQQLDQNVDQFVKNVSENLQNLQKDLQRVEPQMLQVIQLIANQRLQQIRERQERDKTRSFPIE